jgi:hypothetical protein
MRKMNIKFCFSGWINSFNIDFVLDTQTGNWIDVPVGTTSEQMKKKLENGDWAISFQDAVKFGDCEAELFDYDVAE